MILVFAVRFVLVVLDLFSVFSNIMLTPLIHMHYTHMFAHRSLHTDLICDAWKVLGLDFYMVLCRVLDYIVPRLIITLFAV